MWAIPSHSRPDGIMTETPPLATLPLPTDAYTPWFTRVVAFVIDWAPIGLVWSVPFLVMLASGDTQCIGSTYFGAQDYRCSSGGYDFWIGFLGFALLLLVLYPLWNFGYRQGRKGQSVGKSLMKFKVVSEK